MNQLNNAVPCPCHPGTLCTGAGSQKEKFCCYRFVQTLADLHKDDDDDD